MNIHSFLADGDQQSNKYKIVLNITSKFQAQRKNDSGESVLGDRYLRSCALKSAQQGDYTEAIATLTQLISRHPHNAIDYNNRGLIISKVVKGKKRLTTIIPPSSLIPIWLVLIIIGQITTRLVEN